MRKYTTTRLLFDQCCSARPGRCGAANAKARSPSPRPTWLTSSYWSGRRDSNPRPAPWQGAALPTEPLPHGGDYSTARGEMQISRPVACRQPLTPHRGVIQYDAEPKRQTIVVENAPCLSFARTNGSSCTTSPHPTPSIVENHAWIGSAAFRIANATRIGRPDGSIICTPIPWRRRSRVPFHLGRRVSLPKTVSHSRHLFVIADLRPVSAGPPPDDVAARPWLSPQRDRANGGRAPCE